MKIRKVKSTIAKHVLREMSREVRKRRRMDKLNRVPNDLKDIWNDIKGLTKSSKKFVTNWCHGFERNSRRMCSVV